MTLAQMRTAIQELGYGSDTATAQTAAINATLRRIEGYRRWPWQEVDVATGSLALGADVVTHAITDLLYVDSVRIESGTEYRELEYIEPQELRSRQHLDRDNGTPEYWSKYEGEIRVYPQADKAYTVTIDYIKDPADLSADGDTPTLPATYHDVLVFGAASLLAMRERDWSAFQLYDAHYKERRSEMLGAVGVRQRQNATHVKKSNYWTKTRFW